MSNLTKQQASAEISKKLSAAMGLIKECERLSDRHGVPFDIDLGENAKLHTYYPRDRDRLDHKTADPYWYVEDGWMNSSTNC